MYLPPKKRLQTHGSNLDGRLYDNSFAPASGRSSCHGNEHHGIALIKFRPSWLFPPPTKAVFLCAAVKLQCCHMLERRSSQHPPPFVQNSIVANGFGCLYQETFIWAWQNGNTCTEPGLMKEGIGLGVRCIGLHGLVCHAMTFACWFRFLSLGVAGWLVVSLQKRVQLSE